MSLKWYFCLTIYTCVPAMSERYGWCMVVLACNDWLNCYLCTWLVTYNCHTYNLLYFPYWNCIYDSFIKLIKLFFKLSISWWRMSVKLSMKEYESSEVDQEFRQHLKFSFYYEGFIFSDILWTSFLIKHKVDSLFIFFFLEFLFISYWFFHLLSYMKTNWIGPL